jgi:hypothetical protein
MPIEPLHSWALDAVAEIRRLREALQRIADATPANTNSETAARMASWVHAVAVTALAEETEIGGGDV